MSLRIRLDGHDVKEDDLTEKGKMTIKNLSFVEARLIELRKQQVLLTKAMNTYVSDLKIEIVRNKTGVDLRSILGEE
jgi:hypothetical protein